MVAAAFCMALYNVWSRPFLSRSGPIPFAAFGMGVGAVCLSTFAALNGGFAQLAALSAVQWIASGYLAIVCGAFIFFLWAFALGRAAPTLVAVSVAVNPVTASIFGVVFLGEPVSANLIIGLMAVLVGIGVASGAVGWCGIVTRRSAPAAAVTGSDADRSEWHQEQAFTDLRFKHDHGVSLKPTAIDQCQAGNRNAEGNAAKYSPIPKDR